MCADEITLLREHPNPRISTVNRSEKKRGGYKMVRWQKKRAVQLTGLTSRLLRKKKAIHKHTFAAAIVYVDDRWLEKIS